MDDPSALPGDSPRGNRAHYLRDAAEYDYAPPADTQLAQGERRRAQLLMRLAGLAPGGPGRPARRGEWVADLGMGGGQLVELLAGAGYAPLGFDLAWTNCAKGRASRPGVADHALLAAGDLFHLPLPPASVRTAFCSEVLEHLEQPAEAIREIGRVVRSGGVLVASCPWRQRIEWHLCIHCNRPTPIHAHLHSVHESRLGGWMEAGGFEVKRFVRFNHRALLTLRWARTAARLPYAVWRVVDAAAIAAWKIPCHFAAVGVRR